MPARDKQVGGTHYKSQAIQPWDVIDTWPLAERIGFYRGNLLKYTMRLHDKDAPADNVGKAEHYAAKLREVLGEPEYASICPVSGVRCHASPCPTANECYKRSMGDGVPPPPINTNTGMCPIDSELCTFRCGPDVMCKRLASRGT